jgi:hypothetical protein
VGDSSLLVLVGAGSRGYVTRPLVASRLLKADGVEGCLDQEQFVVGRAVAARPDLLRITERAGHLGLGLHSTKPPLVEGVALDTDPFEQFSGILTSPPNSAGIRVGT